MDGDAPSRIHTLEHPAPHLRRSQRVKRILDVSLIALDAVMLGSAFTFGYLARMTLPLFLIPVNPPQFTQYVITLILHIIVIMTLFYSSRLYHQRRAVSRIDQAREIIGTVTVGALLVNGIQDVLFRSLIYDLVEYPRSMLFYVWIFSMALVIVGREFHQAIRVRLRESGVERANLLIVGMGKIARDIARTIQSRPDLGYRIVGVVPLRATNKENTFGVPVLGDARDLPYLIDTYGVEQVIIAVPDAAREELTDLIKLCRRGQVDIKIYPDLFSYMARDISVDDLGGTPLITVRDIALRGWKMSLKRALDVIVSVMGLVALSPLMLLTALLIRLESPGAVFYTQERMGMDERPFKMIKFRTMRSDAEHAGPGWTVQNDPRVTRLGRLMRKTSWDELPQLINVLIGEMSLVGPRPERPVYVRQFSQSIPRYMERHREKAGMTGWAQVNGLRGDTSIEERTQYDLWYVENWSVWLDIKIIIRTILQVLLRRDENAY
jgi:exopolysaccharide biosynthesis polyprenyl glycosylphosphotransferase